MNNNSYVNEIERNRRVLASRRSNRNRKTNLYPIIEEELNVTRMNNVNFPGRKRVSSRRTPSPVTVIYEEKEELPGGKSKSRSKSRSKSKSRKTRSKSRGGRSKSRGGRSKSRSIRSKSRGGRSKSRSFSVGKYKAKAGNKLRSKSRTRSKSRSRK